MKESFNPSSVAIGPGTLWVDGMDVSPVGARIVPTVNCRNCGAPARLDRRDCEYCGTSFVLAPSSQFKQVHFYTDESEEPVITRVIAR
jgi:hypothetical protein